MFEKNSRKVYSRTTTKFIPLLQSELGYFWQNGTEKFQEQDWYPNEKMVMVPVCLYGRYGSSEYVGAVSY